MKAVNISISLRLTLWFGAIFFLGWTLFGVAMWGVLKQTLTYERHETLARRLDRLEQLLDDEHDSDDLQRNLRDFARATGNGLIQIRHADGTLAFPAVSNPASSFPWPHANPAQAEVFVHAVTDDKPYWVMGRPATLEGESYILLAAAPESGNLLVLERFLSGLLAVAPVVLAISCLAGYWVSRRALRPVDAITQTAKSISIRSLSERLPVASTRDELQRLAETWNDMLSRLESAVNQIKRFTADASHELRGPLSYVRTVSEVALLNPSIDPQSQTAFRDIVDESETAAVLLENMLTLARADADVASGRATPVDLAEVVQRAASLAAPIAEQRQIELRLENTSAAQIVLGDAGALQRLAWILIDNALKYTAAGGRVLVSVRGTPRDTTLRVTDTGIGISAEDLPHIFERFYRADPSRSLVPGNGLGLAIARWIVETHRGSITATSQVDDGTSIQVVLPRTINP